MLSGVNNERLEDVATPLHCGDDGRDLHEVRPCPNDIYDFQHLFLFSHKKAQNTQNSSCAFCAFLWRSLQANNSRLAFASHIAVERIACVDDQRAQRADALVVDVAVVCDDYHAVGRLKFVVG